MSKDFMDSVRLMGGTGTPVSDCWYNVCRSLEWDIRDDIDDPERFTPVFLAWSKKLGRLIPVICEAYAYMPGDKTDRLAKEAFREVGKLYPDGALLVFRGMPFREVDGQYYSFGGMLYHNKAWHEFAINRHVHGIDDVLAQIESGFIFGEAMPKFADEHTEIAVPFTLMAYGHDPMTEGVQIMRVKSGDWYMLIC
ncbi:hypothetical protein [Ralstonia pseudosolanacearum]|uniref:hypothetical protein n=1 Tax=Ralstonia pseudosolanacearum TaxID=1310165 RepID=UPI003CF3263C